MVLSSLHICQALFHFVMSWRQGYFQLRYLKFISLLVKVFPATQYWWRGITDKKFQMQAKTSKTQQNLAQLSPSLFCIVSLLCIHNIHFDPIKYWTFLFFTISNIYIIPKGKKVDKPGQSLNSTTLFCEVSNMNQPHCFVCKWHLYIFN